MGYEEEVLGNMAFLWRGTNNWYLFSYFERDICIIMNALKNMTIIAKWI